MLKLFKKVITNKNKTEDKPIKAHWKCFKNYKNEKIKSKQYVEFAIIEKGVIWSIAYVQGNTIPATPWGSFYKKWTHYRILD